MDSFHLALTAALGLGAGILAFVGCFWSERKRKRGFQRWELEVEELAVQAIRDDARAVESKLALLEAIGRVPDDFNPTVFLTCRYGEGIQRSVLFEAEKQGIVPVGTLERVFPPVAGAVLPPRPGEGVSPAPPPADWGASSPSSAPAAPAPGPARLRVVGAHVVGADSAGREA